MDRQGTDMATRREGWYWIGLGVLALGISWNTPGAGPQWMDSISGKVREVAETASDNVTAYMGSVLPAEGSRDLLVGPANRDALVAQANARIACANAALAREQARWNRHEAKKLRAVDRHLRHLRIVGPGRIFVDVPQPVASSEGTL